MTTRLAVALGVLFLLAGCGANEPAAKAAPAPIRVAGVIKADDGLGGALKYRRQQDDCVATGDLAHTLAKGQQSVVISDPDGKQVALATIESTTYGSVKSGGDEYFSGVCNFVFATKGVLPQSGVFTATVPDLDVSARFTVGTADHVTIRYKP